MSKDLEININNNSGREERVFTFENIELRKTKDDKPQLVGHAAVFNQLSEDLGGFRERIYKGAFTKTIQEADIRALFNHEAMYILGRNKSKTLHLEEDNNGLWIEITPPDNQLIRDLVLSPIERGDIDQMSFGFKKVKDNWIEENELIIRNLYEVKLFDVAPVTFPAYVNTDIAVREFRSLYAVNIDLKKQNLINLLKKKLQIAEI